MPTNELSEMSKEEVVNIFTAEIISRLSSGEAAIARVAELEKEVERLKEQEEFWKKNRGVQELNKLRDKLTAANRAVEAMFECKYEPDKLLCIYQGYKNEAGK